MKRRQLTFSAAATAAAALALSLQQRSALAQAPQPAPQPPQAGNDYTVLSTPASVEAPAGKIEVVEFFWYDCGFCNAFEPALEAWIRRQPPEVVVRRVPVGFRDSFVPLQRLFYTLEAMGQLEALHAKVFAAIHGPAPELPKAAKGPQLAEWAARQGLDGNRFVALYNAPETGEKVGRASRLQNQYGVEGVPALGVAGRFYTDGDLAKSLRRSLQVADFLIAEVRAGR